MKISSLLCLPLVAATSSTVQAAAPSWYPGAESTHQVFRFTTNADPSPASLDVNPHGNPTADITLGRFAAGWQDPTVGFALAGPVTPGAPGNPRDGAWELGISGTITTTIPFTSAPSFLDVQFHVTSVYFQDLSQPPIFSTPGFTPVGLAQTTVFIEDDGLGDGWFERTWSGTFIGVTASQIPFHLTSAPSGSFIADYQIYTNAVPEPSLLGLASLAGLLALRRRRVCALAE